MVPPDTSLFPIEALAPFHAHLQAIGAVGSLIYVAGFLMLQSGRLCGNGLAYPASKLVAAVCVLASLTTAFNLAAFLTQLSFVAIAFYGIGFRLRRLPRRAAPPRRKPH